MPYFAKQPGAARAGCRTNRSPAVLPIWPLAYGPPSFRRAARAHMRYVSSLSDLSCRPLSVAPARPPPQRLEQRLTGIESRRQLRALCLLWGEIPADIRSVRRQSEHSELHRHGRRMPDLGRGFSAWRLRSSESANFLYAFHRHPPLYYADEVANGRVSRSARPHFLCPRAQVGRRGRPQTSPSSLMLAASSAAQVEPKPSTRCRMPDGPMLISHPELSHPQPPADADDATFVAIVQEP